MDELRDNLAHPSAEAQPAPKAPQPIAVGSEAIRQKAIAAIQEVYDPEIPVNIWELGLIYEVDVSEQRDVTVQMTLTSPACPAAQDLPGRVAPPSAASPKSPTSTSKSSGTRPGRPTACPKSPSLSSECSEISATAS